jgi:hypothetical protein
MLRRIALVLFLVYEIVDFADPLMPGAVNFNDDETVYSARVEDGAVRIVAPPLLVEHAPAAPLHDDAHRSRRVAAVLPPRPTTATGPSHHRTYPPRHTPQDSLDDH